MPHGAVGAFAAQEPHKNPQPATNRPARPKARRAARSGILASGAGRPATRGDGHQVIELECGITVYPAREVQDRWRAVWYENGKRRHCEWTTEERLAAKLEKVTKRLAADAPNMERTRSPARSCRLRRSTAPPPRR